MFTFQITISEHCLPNTKAKAYTTTPSQKLYNKLSVYGPAKKLIKDKSINGIFILN